MLQRVNDQHHTTYGFLSLLVMDRPSPIHLCQFVLCCAMLQRVEVCGGLVLATSYLSRFVLCCAMLRCAEERGKCTVVL